MIRHGPGDKGIDIIFIDTHYGLTETRVGIQAKHFDERKEIGRHVVDETAAGAEAEEIDIAIIVTTGSFSKEAEDAALQYSESGLRIELVDGPQLASLIVELGVPEPSGVAS